MRFLRDFVSSVLPPRIGPPHQPETASAVFDQVYRERSWGRKLSQRYFSGLGSHDPQIVEPYIAAVRQFLQSLGSPPDVVDLGCGDFNVGRRLRPHCARYVACDVVADLVAYNKQKFAAQDVDFRCVDMINDALPDGDVAFLRQVLQHLTNEQIAKVVPKLAKYRYLVLTEHVPTSANFVPNLDHTAGSGTRLARNSGVVIGEPPFSFRYLSQQDMCAMEKYGGLVKTSVYKIS